MTWSHTKTKKAIARCIQISHLLSIWIFSIIIIHCNISCARGFSLCITKSTQPFTIRNLSNMSAAYTASHLRGFLQLFGGDKQRREGPLSLINKQSSVLTSTAAERTEHYKRDVCCSGRDNCITAGATLSTPT